MIQPMVSEAPNPEGFPIYGIPDNLRRAIINAAHQSNTSITPVAISALSAMSLVCQGLIKVQRLEKLISPVSLFMLSIQPSGERKSAVNSSIFKGVYRFIEETTERLAEEKSRHAARYSVWSATKRGLMNALRRKIESGDAGSDIAEQLEAHILLEPRPPKLVKLIHENTTPSALLRNLVEAYPTTALISDEALVVLKNGGLSDVGTLNKLWDGGRIEMDRISTGATVISESALTVALFLQNGVFQQLMRDKGDLLRHSGFLARCFVIEPCPMAGSRLLAYKVAADDNALQWFWNRCTELLRMQIPKDGTPPPEKTVLTFSPEAQALWMRHHDEVEQMLLPNGALAIHPDFGSKHVDKVARLAALLHFFEGYEGDISYTTLDQAINLGLWFGNEFIRLFSPPLEHSQEQMDANLLLKWLTDQFHSQRICCWYRNLVRQFGPNPLRNKARLEAALDLLEYQQFIAQYTDINTKKRLVGLTVSYMNLLTSLQY